MSSIQSELGVDRTFAARKTNQLSIEARRQRAIDDLLAIAMYL